MFNVLRKPRESDNLATGISSLNFLTADVKVRPSSAAANVPNQPTSEMYVMVPPDAVSPPTAKPIGKPPFSKQTGTTPPLSVPSVLRNETVPLVQKNAPSVLGRQNNVVPADNTLAVLRGEEQPPQVQGRPSVLPRGMKQIASMGIPANAPLSVFPRGMNQNSPLAMSDSMLFGNTGGNVEKAARAWAPNKTPIFLAVQANPVMQRSRITNKIGRVANRNGATIGVTKMRLF